MSANIKASVDGTQAIIGVGGVDQMTVSNAGVVTANSFVGLNGYVANPRNFGAIGNGVVDDTNAINLAYAAAKANKGILQIPIGTFRFTSQLNWDQGVDVVGMHKEDSVLLKDGNFDGIKISGSGSIYSNFYVKGNAGNGGCGIILSLTSYQDINNINVQYHGSHGIKYDYSLGSNSEISYITLRQSSISNNSGDGIRLDGTNANYPTEYCNVCSFNDLAINNNGGIGFNQTGNQNSGYHVGSNIVIQNNAAGGMFICGIQSNLNVYLESNPIFDLKLETTSIRNFITCSHPATILDYGTRNMFLESGSLSIKYINPVRKPLGRGDDQLVYGGSASSTGNYNGGDLVIGGGDPNGTGTPGSVFIQTGNLRFPSTQIPSTDGNTLDDYKEGNWIPVMSSTGATFTYTSGGRYQKVGNRVHLSGFIDTSAAASGTLTNDFSIIGLPFQSNNLGYGYSGTIGYVASINWNPSAKQLMARVPANSTSIELNWLTTASIPLIASDVNSSDFRINFAVTYETIN